MTEPAKEENNARPTLSRAFLSRWKQIKFPSLRTQLVFWALTAAGLIADLWSKWAVFEFLTQRPTGDMPIIDGFFRLVLVENTGAAFGIAAGQRWFLSVVSIIALIMVIGIFLFNSGRSKITNIALALFTAGVCGNLYDRIFNDGRVRDFIDIVYWPGKHWPAFNIADSMLCIGVAILLIRSFLTDRPGQERGQQRK